MCRFSPAAPTGASPAAGTRGSAKPPDEAGGNIKELACLFEHGSLQEQLHDVLGLEKLSPSSPKLGRSQRLSPSVVTLEHLVACCQSPDELFLFTFLESDSLHLVY